MPNPLDTGTWAAVTEVLTRSKRLGTDPAQALNEVRLILSPEVDKEIRLQAMTYLCRQVQSFRPAEFLRRKFSAEYPTTPKDMYNCILEFMEEVIVGWEEQQ